MFNRRSRKKAMAEVMKSLTVSICQRQRQRMFFSTENLEEKRHGLAARNFLPPACWLDRSGISALNPVVIC